MINKIKKSIWIFFLQVKLKKDPIIRTLEHQEEEQELHNLSNFVLGWEYLWDFWDTRYVHLTYSDNPLCTPNLVG